MDKIWKNTLSVVAFFILLAGAFFAGKIYNAQHDENAEYMQAEDESDLKLPGETEKVVTTKEEVKYELQEISEFTTHEAEYHVDLEKDFSRSLLDDFEIPGTTNQIAITCDGIVKIGFDIKDVEVQVDEESRTIIVSLPEMKVNDNYIIWESVECDEKNNILNPIDFKQYKTMISEIEKKGLEKAEEEGAYDAAEDSAERLISTVLDNFKGYEVKVL